MDAILGNCVGVIETALRAHFAPHMLAYKDLTRRRDTETRLCVKRTFRALNAYYASDPRARLTGG